MLGMIRTGSSTSRSKHRHPGGRIVVLAEHFQLDEVVAVGRRQRLLHQVVVLRDVPIKSFELVMLGETLLPLAMLSGILGGEDEALT